MDSVRAFTEDGKGPPFVAHSPIMQGVLTLVDKVAPTDWTVLLEGETGTGKTLFAQVIHSRSDRKSKPFITFDCAAVPETLLESELFGYEKGTFTGAAQSRAGQFEQAHRGTLFIDEIGNLSLMAQTKLLTVLQERRVRRIGGKDVPLDVRVIAATNQNLRTMVQAGQFRNDLYYRLSIFTIAVPALRDRREDVPALVERYLREAFGILHKPLDSIPSELIAALERYDWPGNVRELQNFCKRIALLTEGIICPAEILMALAPSGVAYPNLTPSSDTFSGINSLPGQENAECSMRVGLSRLLKSIPTENRSLPGIVRHLTETLEREIIVSTLIQANGNKAEAARILKVNYKTLYHKIQNLVIHQREYRNGPEKTD